MKPDSTHARFAVCGASNHAGAALRTAEAHPPQSPFLRKGEDEGANHPGQQEGHRVQRGWMQRATRCGNVKRIAGLVLALTTASAFAAVPPNIQAVQPDHLTDYWVMTNTSLNVDVPNSGVNLSKPTCSAVTYMIGSDGVPRDIVVRKTIPAGDLKTVAASAVKDMHYVVGAKNATHDPVFTYIVIPFNLPADPAARKQITDACVLKDFPNGYR